jgi:hypothetical protein
LVLTVLTRDHFFVGEYNKLRKRNIGLISFYNRSMVNEYKLCLPSHLKIFNVFNVKHLTPYFVDASGDGVNSRTSSSNLEKRTQGSTNGVEITHTTSIQKALSSVYIVVTKHNSMRTILRPKILCFYLRITIFIFILFFILESI